MNDAKHAQEKLVVDANTAEIPFRVYGLSTQGNVGYFFTEADATLFATASDLLAELRAAQQIIRNALQIMTTPQKMEWGRANTRDEVEGDGTTRANERAAVIARATGD